MKKQSAEFYLGVAVWFLDLLVAYGMWLLGDETVDISRAITMSNIALVAALYLLFITGYLLSYGVFVKSDSQLIKIVGLVLSSVAVLGLTVFFFFAMVALLAVLIIIQLPNYVNEKLSLVVAILVPCLGLLVDVFLQREFDYTVIIIYGTFNILALLTNFRLIAERKAKSESEQLVRELKATQILLSATTKRDERTRIARDLHDALGHQLTALSLQLEVASHVKDESQKQYLQQAKAISTTLLSEVRTTVSELRIKKDSSLGEALETLTQGLPNLSVQLVIDLDEELIDARQSEVIFRCIQEALTNIVKHSHASLCDINLSIASQSLALSIKDNGKNSVPIIPGNGLTGMKERVANIGGTLDYQVLEDGFNLTVNFPLDI